MVDVVVELHLEHVADLADRLGAQDVERVWLGAGVGVAHQSRQSHLRPGAVGDDQLMAQRSLTEDPGGIARGMCLPGRVERLATMKQSIAAQRDDGAGQAHAVGSQSCARSSHGIRPRSSRSLDVPSVQAAATHARTTAGRQAYPVHRVRRGERTGRPEGARRDGPCGVCGPGGGDVQSCTSSRAEIPFGQATRGDVRLSFALVTPSRRRCVVARSVAHSGATRPGESWATLGSGRSARSTTAISPRSRSNGKPIRTGSASHRRRGRGR